MLSIQQRDIYYKREKCITYVCNTCPTYVVHDTTRPVYEQKLQKANHNTFRTDKVQRKNKL